MRLVKDAMVALGIISMLGALAGGVAGFALGAIIAIYGVGIGVFTRLFFRWIGCKRKILTSLVAAILASATFFAYIVFVPSSSGSHGDIYIICEYTILFLGVPILAVIGWTFGSGRWETEKIDCSSD